MLNTSMLSMGRKLGTYGHVVLLDKTPAAYALTDYLVRRRICTQDQYRIIEELVEASQLKDPEAMQDEIARIPRPEILGPTADLSAFSTHQYKCLLDALARELHQRFTHIRGFMHNNQAGAKETLYMLYDMHRNHIAVLEFPF